MAFKSSLYYHIHVTVNLLLRSKSKFLAWIFKSGGKNTLSLPLAKISGHGEACRDVDPS